MAKSLTEIAKAYANWLNTQYGGGGVRFVETAKYSNQSSLNDYHQYEIKVTGSEIVYDPNAPSPKPGTIDSVVTAFTNQSSVEQSVIYTQSLSTTQTCTWSVTEKLQIGLEVSCKAGLPAVAEVTTKVSTNLELSSSQGSTKSETKVWGVTQNIKCAPYTVMDVQMYINTATYDIRWTGLTSLEGSVAVWFNNKVALNGDGNKHYLWFPRIGSVIAECDKYNIIDVNGYSSMWGSVLAESRGVFTGGQGVQVGISYHERLKDGDMGPDAKQPISYDIPLDEDGNSYYISALD